MKAIPLFILLECLLLDSLGQVTDFISYDRLREQNDQLTQELSALRSRLQYLTNECKCPSQTPCQYKGRTYNYLAKFRDGECERCACLENGEVKCNFATSIPGCIDECIRNPCYNGGTCVSLGSNKYRCICPPSCSGLRCEIRDAHICFLPLDRGTACDSSSPSTMFYFEPRVDDCVVSEYAGCGGNSNRFNSYTECRMSCVSGTCCVRSLLRDDIVYGHSPSGRDRYGFLDRVNEQGEKATVQTATAFGSLRYRYQNTDYKGYRTDGYNRDRYSRSGYDCRGVDGDLLSEDGLNLGFDYSCDLLSKTECMRRNDKQQLHTEVVSFTVGVTECLPDACHNSTQCRGCVYNGQHYQYEQSFSNGCTQCICTRFGSVQCTCNKVTKRKEVRDMTAVEVADYQRAVSKLYKQGRWIEFSEMYEKHLPHSHATGHNFLPWHRAMLNQLELALQSAAGSCDLTIPYFDWTLDVGALMDSPIWRAGLFGGSGRDDCVEYHPFEGDAPWSPCLRRNFNSSVALPDAVAVERIKRTVDFNSLSNQLTSASFLFRLWVGGHAVTRNVIYDPVVVSHYAFIDKIWHEWQQRGDNYINLDQKSRYRPLMPFGLSADDVNSSPAQLCVDYAALNSLCVADKSTTGRPYNMANPRAFDANGYDSAGFDHLGFNRQGYNGDGFDRDGYDLFGYDRYGFNKRGVSKLGVTREGRTTADFDASVLDKQNYTRLGVDIRGLDLSGRDIFGYNSRGYDSEGCNGHFNDGYHYVKQKYKLDLELSTLNDRQLQKISRLCSDLSVPRPWIFISSWVVVDPTHQLRGNPQVLAPPQVVPEEKLWVPAGPDSRFCIEVKLYSPCALGETPRYANCDGLDLCSRSECPSYGSSAKCRTMGCEDTCRKEWYHNGMVVTSSCIGCKDAASGRTYREGDIWLAADGCTRCQCVAGVSKCSGCPKVTCSHPDVSACCPTCDGCSYEGKTYSNSAIFISTSRPCDRCQCRAGSVTCITTKCPPLDGCRDPLTLEGACCAICLSCGRRRNGERWRDDECTTCECMDGRVKCDRIDCGPNRCTHPVTVHGICCPQCTACLYQGAYYKDRQSFSPDGCQSCMCERGSVTCSPPSCPPADCDDTYIPAGSCCPTCKNGCDYSGKHYNNGEIFTPGFNRCMNCSCTENKVRCNNVNCPPTPQLNCSRPIALPGDCCPSFCPSCVFDGEEYGHGNSWHPASRPCERCLCFNGVVSCRTRIRCERTCSYGVMRDGDCCSSCTDCEVDGEVHADGTTFAHLSANGCAECVCRGGNVQCSARRELCPPADCTNPVQIPNTCCPRCPGCSNGRSHGDRWRNERDRCEICECRDELVSCYKQPCSDVEGGCVTLYTPAGQCCPLCMDCQLTDGELALNGTDFEMESKPCSTCTCVNGEVSCSKKACAPTPCDKPVLLPDQCCPTCDSCTSTDGVEYDNGQQFVLDADPCSTCSCQDGVITCLPSPCPSLDCDTPVEVAGRCCPTCGECTSSSGIIYSNGDRFDSPTDRCAQCHCTDGVISCDRKQCPAIACDDPVTLANRCCPSCINKHCDHNGTRLADGESVDVGCRECKCVTGRITCRVKSCPLINCPNPVMGECCPTCTDCQFSGERIPSGSYITDNSTCTNCTCQDGTVSCVPQQCQPANCNSPTLEGCCKRCGGGCSLYNDDNYLYSNGEMFVSPDNPCQSCTCVNGNLDCQIKNCPQLDCRETYRPPGECCAKCSGCWFTPSSISSTGQPVLGGNGPLGVFGGVATPPTLPPVYIPDGDSFYEEADCTNCSCRTGSLTCLPVQQCPPTTCLNPRTDACCPSCSACSYGNETLMEGEVSLNIDDPECQSCTCTGGSVLCYLDCETQLSCAGGTKLDTCGCEVCDDDEPVCTLETNGTVTYKSGESWRDANNCYCTCQAGVSTCETCELDLQCPYTEPDPDTCCGVRCKGCTVQQIHYFSGATWSQDGCRQTCSCHTGIVTCVEKLTPDDHCIDAKLECDTVSVAPAETCCGVSDVSLACGCQGPNGALEVGQTFRPNTTDCTVCTCVEDGIGRTHLECYEPVCPDVTGCPAGGLYLPDAASCCQICKHSIPYECTEQVEGELIEPPYDACQECLCTSNSWICDTKTCPYIDCPPSEQLTKPGECCPSCVGCYTDTVRQAHGSSWPHPTDPCATCQCSYGDITCNNVITCPPLFCTEGRKPFTPVGECCQICGDPVTGDDCLDTRGRTRSHGSGWPINDCALCVCLFGKVNCTTESCPPIDCLSDETLVIEEGVCCPKCVKQPALCKVYGDPHYRTFDGETLHFQGFCSYEMVADCDADTFKIVAVHDDRSTQSVSWIKGAVVITSDLTIELGQGLWAEVNGINVTFPFQHQSGLTIHQHPTDVQVFSPSLGFKFTWDGAAYGEVEADTKLKNKLCGLCGNFNDDPKDELTTREGTLVASHANFGDSWKVEGSQCSALSSDVNPCDVVGYEVKKKAIEECAIIQGELFAPCHRAVPPEDYVYSCVYDMCACNSSSQCLCDVLTAYSVACKNSYVRIQWRTHDRCAINCDTRRGFLFDDCGPVCPRTCDNFNRALGDLEEECLKPCEPSCQCPAGLVQHNGKCITTDLCP